MNFDFKLSQCEPMPEMVRIDRGDGNGNGLFSVSKELAAEIIRRWNGFPKALKALKEAESMLDGEHLRCRVDNKDLYQVVDELEETPE